MTYIINYMCNEIIKYAIDRINEVVKDEFKIDESSLASVMPRYMLDIIYEHEIKPLWDNGGLSNFLIDYKTGEVKITPAHAIRCIEVNIDV